jgi:nicotinamide-nucleotide amidase
METHAQRPPVIETLATGDEVVNGDVVDSNSAHVCRLLMRLGLPTTRHQALPDDRALLLDGLRAIGERADLCVASGGLGPTEDDLTADIVGELLGVPVDIDETAVARMKERFARLGYRFSENNRRSARVPHGADVMQNEVGTAPAFSVRIGRCQFFFLPGVPQEFRFFVDAFVLPWAEKRWPVGNTAFAQLKTLGWGESHLAEKFQDFPSRFPAVKLGYRAHSPEVWLKLTATADSREEARRVLGPAIDEAMCRVGDSVFGRDDEELPELTHRKLLASGRKLVLAESCTGGLLAHLLTANPGSSEYFVGGAVTYSNALKESVLGVPADLLASKGAVSAEVARAMAEGALAHLGGDLAVAITGIAGPGGGTAEKPVGLVYLALARRDTVGGITTQVAEQRYRDSRERVQKAAAWSALDLLRKGV